LEDYDRPNEILYFTNRFELGFESIYPKFQQAAPVLATVSQADFERCENYTLPDFSATQSTTMSMGKIKMHSSMLSDFGLTDDAVKAYCLKVEVKGTDFQGRPLAVESRHDSIETVAAYLKLINIPCLFDLGTRNHSPRPGTLLLNMLDDRTYYHVIKPDVLQREPLTNRKKVQRMKEAVQACHVNIDVSEVVITVLGYLVEEE
jgi:hypothetical protein